MSSVPVKRRLAAILAADAVGYSRMMATDEEGTAKILAAHRAVIDGILQFHEGRIVSTAGDSVLAEFASPTQAVRCAVEIQDALKTRNDSLPEQSRLQFRIGVNLGDVMVKGNDLLGDGINVAARLESIAEPGNIYVSSSVYDQIAGKLDLGFVDLGEQSLKNIDRPIRAYRVDRDSRKVTRSMRRPKRPAWVVAGATALVAGFGLAWYAMQFHTAQQAEDARLRAEEAKTRAEAETAKARTEAEQARKAAAEASGTAAVAKHALEQQREAEARAKAQAELAAARADAEATRRKATTELAAAEARRAHEEQLAAQVEATRHKVDAELAAAAQARRAAEAAAAKTAADSVAAAKTAQWIAQFDCVPLGDRPRRFDAIVTATGNKFELRRRHPVQGGWTQMSGTRESDGRLRLSGEFISSRGKPTEVIFDGRFTAERYEAAGRFGSRDCTLSIVHG